MQSTPPTQALHVIDIALRTHNGEAFQTIAPFWGIFRWLLPPSPGGRKSQNFSSSVFTDRWNLTHRVTAQGLMQEDTRWLAQYRDDPFAYPETQISGSAATGSSPRATRSPTSRCSRHT